MRSDRLFGNPAPVDPQPCARTIAPIRAYAREAWEWIVLLSSIGGVAFLIFVIAAGTGAVAR